MKTSLAKEEIGSFLKKQLEFYIPDGYMVDDDYWLEAITIALDRCDNCFKHILMPGYRDEKGESIFSHLHRDQYATFLYFLSNTIWTGYHDKQICDKLLNLQSILHGIFLSYKCEMPNIFLFSHPVGTIIGNAKYSDGLYIGHNVTVNTKSDLHIGKLCALLPGATICGNEPIGDRVSIGVNVTVYNKKIEDNSVVYNEDGQMKIRPCLKEKCWSEEKFDIRL